MAPSFVIQLFLKKMPWKKLMPNEFAKLSPIESFGDIIWIFFLGTRLSYRSPGLKLEHF